ncbi:MAG: LTA synthase family protein, partial [Rubrobacteraceae bacterium]
MLKTFYTTIRGLLSGKDWVYVLALLVPLTIYNLALKASSVAIKDETNGFLSALNLMRSDFLFAIGYVVFWLGVFAIVRSGVAR